MWFCVDYCRLNKHTKVDTYPVPRIEDTLDFLLGATIFATLDFIPGYWQIQMEEADIETTVFACPISLFKFVQMPFRLKNAGATLQLALDLLMMGLSLEEVLVHLDDLIIFAPDFDTFLLGPEHVFQRLREADLKLKLSKCYFGFKKVKYLGHIVSKEGIAPDPDKVQAIEEFLVPTNLRSLRSFLGLAGYYRSII